MSIDPNDAPDGYTAAGPVDPVVNCSGCGFFAEGPGPCPARSNMLRCVPSNRMDRQYVIFIKEEDRVD